MPQAVSELPGLSEAKPRTVTLWTATCQPVAPPSRMACIWQLRVRSEGSLVAVSSARKRSKAKTASLQRELSGTYSAVPCGQPLPEKETDVKLGSVGGSGEMRSRAASPSPRAPPPTAHAAATSEASPRCSSPMIGFRGVGVEGPGREEGEEVPRCLFDLAGTRVETVGRRAEAEGVTGRPLAS